ncbi:MAG: hypothetical protein ACREEV_05705, partial [Dongiaceae bacterium]
MNHIRQQADSLASSRVAAVLGALALAGCTGIGVIDYVQVKSGYGQQQFVYAAGGRDLMTDVQGNSFAMPQEEF